MRLLPASLVLAGLLLAVFPGCEDDEAPGQTSAGQGGSLAGAGQGGALAGAAGQGGAGQSGSAGQSGGTAQGGSPDQGGSAGQSGAAGEAGSLTQGGSSSGNAGQAGAGAGGAGAGQGGAGQAGADQAGQGGAGEGGAAAGMAGAGQGGTLAGMAGAAQGGAPPDGTIVTPCGGGGTMYSDQCVYCGGKAYRIPNCPQTGDNRAVIHGLTELADKPILRRGDNGSAGMSVESAGKLDASGEAFVSLPGCGPYDVIIDADESATCSAGDRIYHYKGEYTVMCIGPDTTFSADCPQ